MELKTLDVYNQEPSASVNNEYPTSRYAFRQPCLHYIVGVRNMGKSFLTSKILAQAKKEKTFDIIYIITPSFNSNKAYFDKYIDKTSVYEPTKESISLVIKRVEDDRDEFERFLKDKIKYEEFKKDMKRKTNKISDENMIYYYDAGFYDSPPKWRYEFEVPPRSLLILDDVIGTPALLQSSGLSRLAIANRHLAPLAENHSQRSACGLAVIILSQSYKFQNGIGRLLRENLSLMTLFLNKQEKMMESLIEELGSSIDEDKFREAYKIATAEKHGNLSCDFRPKCSTLTFRKNLNQAIIFPDMICECDKNNK